MRLYMCGCVNAYLKSVTRNLPDKQYMHIYRFYAEIIHAIFRAYHVDSAGGKFAYIKLDATVKLLSAKRHN